VGGLNGRRRRSGSLGPNAKVLAIMEDLQRALREQEEAEAEGGEGEE